MAMKLMRKYAKRLLILIAIFIIPAFVLWGAGSALRGRSSENYAGKIFGRKVSLKEYSESWNECRNQALMLYGQNLEKIAPLLNLEQQAWERLILLEKAKKEKIRVKDKEIIETIKQFPFFHKDNKFDKETYKTILKYAFNTTLNSFEKQIKNSIMIQKLIKKVLDNVTIKNQEIKKAYLNANEKVKVSYILFETKSFEDKVQITSEKIEQYYQEHKNEFKTPPKIKVKYIPITYKSVEEQIKITPEEIVDYFEMHKEEFDEQDDDIIEEENKKQNEQDINLTEEIKAKIKNILLAQKAKQLVETKAEKVSDFLIRTPDLNKAAQNFSLSVEETDYFSLYEPIPGIGWSQQFSQKAFAMETKEISDAIELYQKGLYFLQILEKKASSIPELNEIKEKVEHKYKVSKAEKLAETKAKEKLQEIKRYINEGIKLKEAINKSNVEAKISTFFKRKDYVKDIGHNEEFISASFSTEIGQLHEKAIPVRKGYCLVRPIEKEDIDEKKFQEEKEEFEEKYIAEKQQQYYYQWLNNLIQKASLENNLDKLRQKSKENNK